MAELMAQMAQGISLEMAQSMASMDRLNDDSRRSLITNIALPVSQSFLIAQRNPVMNSFIYRVIFRGCG